MGGGNRFDIGLANPASPMGACPFLDLVYYKVLDKTTTHNRKYTKN